MCEQQMGLRGGETPLAILFFFPAKSVTFRGVFFIDVIYFTKWAVYHPLLASLILASTQPARCFDSCEASKKACLNPLKWVRAGGAPSS